MDYFKPEENKENEEPPKILNDEVVDEQTQHGFHFLNTMKNLNIIIFNF